MIDYVAENQITYNFVNCISHQNLEHCQLLVLQFQRNTVSEQIQIQTNKYREAQTTNATGYVKFRAIVSTQNFCSQNYGYDPFFIEFRAK